MKVLVLGGSYFLGKEYVLQAYREHDITVFNRGSRPLNLEGVKELKGDRNEALDLIQLAEEKYDVVVDFCAYNKGDISSVLKEILPKQYIYISTCDVYIRGAGRYLDETAPFESRSIAGPEGEYVTGKIALEKELQEEAALMGFSYTSIRPAIIYGPDNYAPREGMYFHWIRQAGQILQPSDTTGEFQLVYVGDVAKAVIKAMGKDGFNQIYNLAPNKMSTYDSFSEALAQAVDLPFQIVPIPLTTVYEKNLPLPFPLTKEESNWYDGNKALKLIGCYTELTEGLRNTWIKSKP